jgi:hypothetical protein
LFNAGPWALEGLDAVFHFAFTREENRQAIVVIRDKTVRVRERHVASASLRVTVDSGWWLGFLAKERRLLWACCFGDCGSRGLPGRCRPLGSASQCKSKIPVFSKKVVELE